MRLGPPALDDPLPPFSLGAFRITGVLGRGGMGRVWDAEHRATGHPAAIKTLSLGHDTTSGDPALFRREVLAMARLDHRGVAQIYEHGVVGEEEAQKSGGLLSRGAPWFAMQRADGGTLGSSVVSGDFAGLRGAMRQILAALGHAHARGILHRDLKPHNVLVLGEPPHRARLLLTDFGLARAVASFTHSGGGTPGYMAPEQINEEMEREGPATDLYALGAVCFELASGVSAFQGANTAQLFEAQLQGRARELVPRFAVPSGLEGWIRRLLEPDPMRRFGSAAAAAHALDALGDAGGTTDATRPSRTARDTLRARPLPSGTAPSGPALGRAAPSRAAPSHTAPSRTAPSRAAPSRAAPSRTAPSRTAPSHTAPSHTAPSRTAPSRTAPSHTAPSRTAPSRTAPSHTAPSHTAPSGAAISHLAPAARPRLGGLARPCVPADVPDSTAPRTAPPVGVGASLFGLRPPPLLGRENALRSIWRCLAELDRDGAPRLVVLSGPTGVGARRLCEVVCEKASEAAGLHRARLRFWAGGTTREVLGAATASLVGATEADDRVRIRARVEQRLSGHADAERLARAAVELVRPSEHADGVGVRFESRRARERAFEDVARACSAGAPLVLWIDGDGDAEEAVAFAARTLARGRLPALLLTTVEGPVPLAVLRRATDSPRALHLPLEPLDRCEARALLGTLFPLRASALEAIADWVGGSPFVAHQLLAHLVESGGLAMAQTGHELIAPLPRDLDELYARRIERVAPSAEGRRALGTAATLGTEVPRRLWHLAVGADAAGVCPHLEERLLSTGLARPTPRGWRFAAPAIAGAALARLEDPRRAYASCAAALEALGAPGARRAAERWEQAGEPRRALPLFLAELEHRVGLRDHARAAAAGEDAERLLRDLEVPLEDDRWSRSLVLRAHAYLGTGDAERSRALLTLASKIDPDDPAVCLASSRLASLSSRPARAHQLALAAMRGHAAANDRDAELEAAVQLAYIACCRGDVDQATRALGRFQAELIEPHRRATFHNTVAGVALARGAFGEAHDHAERAMRYADRLGQPFLVALAWNMMGEARRCAWDVEGALDAYRQATRRLDAIGSPVRAMSHYNELLLRVSAGELEPARTELEAVARRFRGTAFEAKVGRSVSHGLLVCAARARDSTALSRWLERAYALGPDRGYHQRDLAIVAEVAGEEALRASQPGTAARCFELAVSHYAPFDARAARRLRLRIAGLAA